MANRSRSHHSEWDEMNEEYNSTKYNAQYPDDEASGGVELDHCRLYITNIPKVLSIEGLRTAFSKYGTLNEVHLSKDPLKKYALVRFETPGEAKLAMTKLNKTEPLKFNIFIAHKHKKNQDNSREHTRDRHEQGPSSRRSVRDDNSSESRYSHNRRPDLMNGDKDSDDDMLADDEFDVDTLDPEVHLELEQIKLRQLELQEKQARCKRRMLLLKQSKKTANLNQMSSSNRSILPDGRIIVRNNNERNSEHRNVREPEPANFARGPTSAAANGNEPSERDTVCSSQSKTWDVSSEGTSTPSTAVFFFEDGTNEDTDKSSKYMMKFSKSDCSNKTIESTSTLISVTTNDRSNDSIYSNSTVYSDSKKIDVNNSRKSEMTSEDFCNTDEELDETDRLIQLRTSDYADIVDDSLKIVIALAGYPKSKMRLRHMEQFQKCLNDIINMQLKAGFLQKVPTFLDYYLNRCAIVCICKDVETKNWIVRVNPGLQERMGYKLILLTPKIKRLCLAVLKIPKTCWPAKAKDTFKMLQYFNPTLNTSLWKIYSQKKADNIETTSFLIDRVSGEIIRGPNFKNVIDYSQMDFEITGFAEIYYECLLSDSGEDVTSIASRLKFLNTMKSNESTPRSLPEICVKLQELYDKCVTDKNRISDDSVIEIEPVTAENRPDVKKDLEKSPEMDALNEKDEDVISSNETNKNYQEYQKCDLIQDINEVSTSKPITSNNDLDNESKDSKEVSAPVSASDETESINKDCFGRNSSVNSSLYMNTQRDIPFNRRTYYLYVSKELKVALTLDGYPQNRLDGTHIEILKHLFDDYLIEDVRRLRFVNKKNPKFRDVYLANGAVIYICDNLETKGYLTEILPKFINATGLKLTFRDIDSLIKYTKVVMQLPKEQAQIQSLKILNKLKSEYPGLNLDCWKTYSNKTGRQRREFGVDSDSLDIIKSPEFDPVYDGYKLTFRIIDGQKREDSTDGSNKEISISNCKQDLLKKMYVPIDPDVTNTLLTNIRTNHYSDLIADDLKLYVGPSNYPESQIDEVQFQSIKSNIENILLYSECSPIPQFYDMYLFDGVIFIICHDPTSKAWLEQSLDVLNTKLNTNLKATDFRGAVGIVNLAVETYKGIDDVIEVLQSQNPRLRTRFWRVITTDHTRTNLTAVLKIDKLSAEIIKGPDFNKYIDNSPVQFKLGHLQSMIKPKANFEDFAKKLNDTNTGEIESVTERCDINTVSHTEIDRKDDEEDANLKSINKSDEGNLDHNNIEIKSPKISPLTENIDICKVSLKIPMNIVPDKQEDLKVIFNLLQAKNPGLNTRPWKVHADTYPNNGNFIVTMDKESFTVIQRKEFDSTMAGEKLIFTLIASQI